MTGSRRRLWGISAALALAAVVLTLLWKLTPLKDVLSAEAMTELFRPYRDSWLGLPLTLAAYLVLELAFFPVLLLVFATGLVFGPWLGSLYALAGCMASAALGFGLGRRLGRERLERWGGTAVKRVSAKLGRRGILAIFLARKVPAPYMLVNLVAGASKVRFWDYMAGTFLGMGTGVVLLTVLGAQLLALWRRPTLEGAALLGAAFFGPGLLAYALQAHLKRRRLRAG